MNNEKQRCQWCLNSDIEKEYHDNEWGTPLHDDQKLFEFLCLEGAQAGLSWVTILKKRDNYRKAFDHFDAKKIAQYNEVKILQLMQNKGIIRNQRKITAFITNANAFIAIQKEFDSFDNYIWGFVKDRQTIQNNWSHFNEIPSQTVVSENMSKALKKRNFKFVGPTICYAYMQAIGMVNDHTTDCYRHKHLRIFNDSTNTK